MPMEAILIAIGAAMWKLFKELPEIFSGRNKNLREEAEFSDKFFHRLHDGALSPFAEEKGFQALAGNRGVSADSVKHVLSIEQSPSLLRDYVAGRTYLELTVTDGRSSFKFKQKYQPTASRAIRKVVYFLLYMVTIVCALSPLLWVGLLREMKPLPYFLVGGPIFLVLAYMSVDEGHKIKCAEDVIDAQNGEHATVKPDDNARAHPSPP